jgi:hypothetical protein
MGRYRRGPFVASDLLCRNGLIGLGLARRVLLFGLLPLQGTVPGLVPVVLQESSGQSKCLTLDT